MSLVRRRHLEADGSHRPPRDFERLTPGDLMMLWPEDFGWREDMGALATLRGESLTDDEGSVRIDDVRDFVQARLHLVPRFRQQLIIPRRGLGRPLWLDCRDFDIRHHVNVRQLPDNAGEEDLLSAAAHLFGRPFDWTRPLWEMWLLNGLPDRRIGLFIKLHHTIADAEAGLVLLGAFLDTGPSATTTGQPPAWTPGPWPTSGELLRDNARRRVAAMGRAAHSVAHPVQAGRRIRQNLTLMRGMMRHEKAPVTSLNQVVGGADRKLAVARSRVAVGKEIAHAHGGTLNDVLLCAVAGGLRKLLEARGEQVENLTLIANVPVSLHGQAAEGATGNEVGVMFVPLSLGTTDSHQRLRAIAVASAESKPRMFIPPTIAIMSNRLVQRMFWRNMKRQRFSNVYVANVPGPSIPMFFAGCRLDDVFPIMSMVGNVALGVGAISYAGQLNITVVGDEQTSPDLVVLAEGLRETLAELGALSAVPAPADG